MNIRNLPQNWTELQLDLSELSILTKAVADWYFQHETELEQSERVFCERIISLGEKILSAED